MQTSTRTNKQINIITLSFCGRRSEQKSIPLWAINCLAFILRLLPSFPSLLSPFTFFVLARRSLRSRVLRAVLFASKGEGQTSYPHNWRKLSCVPIAFLLCPVTSLLRAKVVLLRQYPGRITWDLDPDLPFRNHCQCLSLTKVSKRDCEVREREKEWEKGGQYNRIKFTSTQTHTHTLTHTPATNSIQHSANLITLSRVGVEDTRQVACIIKLTASASTHYSKDRIHSSLSSLLQSIQLLKFSAAILSTFIFISPETFWETTGQT